MSKKKFAEMMLKTSTLKPAADRHETPDLLAPPSTGMGLTTQRIQLQHKVAELQRRIDELEDGSGEGDTSVKRVGLALVEPNPWQPRRTFDVTELAESIKAVGVMQPVIARKHPTKEGQYQLVAGERRLRGSQQAGIADIPVIEMELDNSSMAILALTENISREDLTDFEVGMSLLKIQREFPNKKTLAESIGMNRTLVYRFLSYGNLPDFIISDLEKSPNLLGGNVAQDLVSSIEKSEKKDEFLAVLQLVWAEVVAGELNQSALLAKLSKLMTPKTPVQEVPGAANQLFLGNKKVGFIKKDSHNFIIKLKSSNLSVDQEQQIRNLINKFFK